MSVEKKPPIRKRWYNFRRRHVVIATAIVGGAALVLILLVLFLFRLGFVDRYVASQIKNTFANYGIRAEIQEFHAGFPPRTVEMNGIELYDATTGEHLGKIDKLLATVKIEDLYALNLQRNINLEDLKIEGFEGWVTFDDQGRSNFRNIRIPPPEPNRRILFAYSTANIEIKNGVIHYGDVRHDISGEGRNLHVTIQPDDPNIPIGTRMTSVTLALSNSTFTYDDRPINNIDVQARWRFNQEKAEIQELVLKSPVAEAKMNGVMDDWRALRYTMNVTSSVDLTQLSDTLQTGTTLRGAGNFSGTITGEGDQFKLNGQMQSDALAADNLRLQGLNVSAAGSVQGKSYEINGKAVADLLNAGDFEIDSLQIAGNVMGTGTNFRWVGELRAVAEKSYGTTLTGLILRDARAEMNEGVLNAHSSQFSANSLSAGGARVNGITASNLQFKNENNVTTGTIANVKAGTVTASGAQVKGVTANNIDITDREGVTSVVVKQVQVGATSAAGAEIGSLNIAGVRLSVRNRRIEGSTADIDAVKSEQAELRYRKVYRGVGFSTYVEICGLGPSRALGPEGWGMQGGYYESSQVRVLPTGAVTVYTGTSPHGQGHETGFAQIAADRLGVAPEIVEVIHGDTNTGPFGKNTYGSRSLAVGGEAIARAAEKVQDKAKRIVAHQLEAAPEDIEVVGGTFRVAGSPDKGMTLAEIAGEAYIPQDLPEGMEAGLDEISFYDPTNFVWPFGAHAC